MKDIWKYLLTVIISVWKYLLTVIISVGLSWVVLQETVKNERGILQETVKNERVILKEIVENESEKNLHQLQVYIEKESGANRNQLSHYYVNAQSSYDLVRMGYDEEVQNLRDEYRMSRDMLFYLWLKYSDRTVAEMLEPNIEIWCFVIPGSEGSNIVKLESCIQGELRWEDD